MLKQQLIAAAILSLGFTATAAPNYFVVTPALSQGGGTGGQGGEGNAPQPSPVSVTLSTGVLPNGVAARAASPQPQGTAYTPFDLKTFASVSGGTGSVTDVMFSLASGSLPQGLTLSAAGVISGTPGVSAANQTFTIAASYQGATSQQTYTINIDPAAPQIALNTGTLPDGSKGEPYSFDFKTLTSVSGGTGGIADAVYSIGGGNIPAGLSLSSDGMLSGTPSATTPQQGQSFTVKGSYQGVDGQRVYVIKINDAVLKVVAIAGGVNHTCAITVEGAAKCWGYGDEGQLGNGSLYRRISPVQVSGLESGVKAIAAGGNHTCAITAGGAAKCWGAGGMSGDGRSYRNIYPSQVVGLESGVKAIAAGVSHTCAITADGAAKCWGRSGWGALGDGGSALNPLVPVQVLGLESGVKAIAAGADHTCAITADGAAKCWGLGNRGQLGNGSTTYNYTQAQQVTGLESWVSIEAGYSHTCAITTGGTAKCWGVGDYGKLGNGSSSNSTVPVQVAGLESGVKAIAAGVHHTCAITADGAAKCWGGGGWGALGDGSDSSLVPVQVTGLESGVKAISTGGYHTCAIAADDAAKCWGQGNYGQLGNRTTSQSSVPVNVVN